MVKHYFQTPNPDLATVQKRLVFWFKEREYEVNSAEADDDCLIQARKTGKLRALTGTNIAFKIRLYLSDEPNEFVFESSTGQWVQNLTGVGISAMFTGGLTLLTGAAGAAWAVKVERDIVEYMEQSLQFKKTKTIEDKGTTATPPPTPPPMPDAPPPLPEPITPRQKAEQKAQNEMKKLSDALADGILVT